MSKTMTTNELATELETDGRTLRKFLRSVTPKDEQPGKGARWVLPGNVREVAKMRKQFDEWTARQVEEKAARDAAKDEEVAVDETE